MEILIRLCDDGMMPPIPYYALFAELMTNYDIDEVFIFCKKIIEECRSGLEIKESKDFANIKLTPEEFKKILLIMCDENKLKQFLEIE